MPQAVLVAALPSLIAGGAAVGGQVIGAKSQSKANNRALAAQKEASTRAEAFERDQDAKNRADDERRDAEDKRRWDVEQANLASTKAEQDARQRYEDQIRYRKMVNIARLTGQPMPEALPDFSGGRSAPMTIGSMSGKPPVSEPMMFAPSRANAMIETADPMFNPLANVQARVSGTGYAPQSVPLSKLAGRRY